MQITMLITREPIEVSEDIEVTVCVDCDEYGTVPMPYGVDAQGREWPLRELELDAAAEIAREEAGEEDR